MRSAVATRLATLCLLALIAGCDRQPGAAGAQSTGVQPILVTQVRRGRFALERRLTGQVRARGEVSVVVREPGEVVEVTAPADAQPVVTGQPLLRLRAPDLELEAAEATAALANSEQVFTRQQRLSELGLAAQTELEQSRAELEVTRIRLERLKLRLDLLQIRAPAAGAFLARELPRPGQWCPSGLEVARIIDPGSLVVEVAVPAAWTTAALAVDQAVLELGGQGERLATVASLSAEADPVRGGRILTLRPQGGAGLVPDALVTARLVAQAREQALTVPVGALVKNEEGWRVAIGPAAGEEGTVRWSRVVPGPSDGEVTVIEEGLAEGAWVVLASELEGVDYWSYERYLGVGK